MATFLVSMTFTNTFAVNSERRDLQTATDIESFFRTNMIVDHFVDMNDHDSSRDLDDYGIDWQTATIDEVNGQCLSTSMIGAAPIIIPDGYRLYVLPPRTPDVDSELYVGRIIPIDDSGYSKQAIRELFMADTRSH